jgi:hypothetical protein
MVAVGESEGTTNASNVVRWRPRGSAVLRRHICHAKNANRDDHNIAKTPTSGVAPKRANQAENETFAQVFQRHFQIRHI